MMASGIGGLPQEKVHILCEPGCWLNSEGKQLADYKFYTICTHCMLCTLTGAVSNMHICMLGVILVIFQPLSYIVPHRWPSQIGAVENGDTCGDRWLYADQLLLIAG